jgi:hypothetical protein
MDGLHVPGLSVIPTDTIVSRIASAFSEGVEDDPAGFALCWLSDDGTSSFQNDWDNQHSQRTCSVPTLRRRGKLACLGAIHGKHDANDERDSCEGPQHATPHHHSYGEYSWSFPNRSKQTRSASSKGRRRTTSSSIDPILPPVGPNPCRSWRKTEATQPGQTKG